MSTHMFGSHFTRWCGPAAAATMWLFWEIGFRFWRLAFLGARGRAHVMRRSLDSLHLEHGGQDARVHARKDHTRRTQTLVRFMDAIDLKAANSWHATPRLLEGAIPAQLWTYQSASRDAVRRQYDHVLVSSHLLAEGCVSDNWYESDHWPVWANIRSCFGDSAGIKGGSSIGPGSSSTMSVHGTSGGWTALAS